jgi:hypothetical protein
MVMIQNKTFFLTWLFGPAITTHSSSDRKQEIHFEIQTWDLNTIALE